MSKVRFGLSNCHYAKITYGTGGAVTFGTPVAIPGAVSFTADESADQTIFYADNTRYFVAYSSNGGSGTLEVAKIPDAMLTDIFGYTLGETSKVLTAHANAEPSHFALLGRVETDTGYDCVVIYDCVATPPNLSANTTTDAKNPDTQSLSLTYVPLPDGKSKAMTTDDTPTSTKTGWFTTVFVENP